MSAGNFYDQMHFNYSDILLNHTLLNRGRYQFNANNPSQNPFYDASDPSGNATKLKAYLASNFPNSPNLAAAGCSHKAPTAWLRTSIHPYTEQLSAGATHQFSSGLYVQAESHGRDMVIDRQTNLMPAPGTSLATDLQNGNLITDDPHFSQITLYENGGWTQSQRCKHELPIIAEAGCTAVFPIRCLARLPTLLPMALAAVC